MIFGKKMGSNCQIVSLPKSPYFTKNRLQFSNIIFPTFLFEFVAKFG
jgi:hypothetical protein